MKKNAISIVFGAFALGACFKMIRNNKKKQERTYTKLFDITEIKKQNEEIWDKVQEVETKVEEVNKEKVKEKVSA